MGEWRNGGMEEWSDGVMEEWRSGGMEEWRNACPTPTQEVAGREVGSEVKMKGLRVCWISKPDSFFQTCQSLSTRNETIFIKP